MSCCSKEKDSRSGDYIAQYGSKSWELDALDPEYIEQLIRQEVDLIRDDPLYDHQMVTEAVMVKTLKELAEEHK